MYSKSYNNGFLLTKLFVPIALLFFLSTNLRASPLYYSYEGVITGFSSYNDAITLDDYDVVLGLTTVSYIFETDFSRNTSASGGGYERFYSDLLSGGVVNGEHPENNESYNVVFSGFNSQGHMQGGSRVDISTTDDVTTSWRVEDWYVGQSLHLIDGGYFSSGSGGAVYFFGDVELTSISSINPIPEPGTSALFALALGILGLSQGRKCSRSLYA